MGGLLPITAILASIFCAGPAFAAATGLLLIPTADTIGANRYQLQLEVDSSFGLSPLHYWFLDTEAGISDNVELGVDINLLQRPKPRVLANWKYAFAPTGPRRTGAAIGMDNWDEKPLTGPYFLTTADLGAVRVTSGVTYLFRAYRLVGGIDTGFDRKLTWMADYISGPGQFISVGASYQMNPDFQLVGGLVFPNSGGSVLFTVQFAWGGKFAQPPK